MQNELDCRWILNTAHSESVYKSVAFTRISVETHWLFDIINMTEFMA